MEQTFKILDFILESLIHIWPYLLITIPIAVGVKLSGASKYISTALNKSPYVSIILATLIGAMSPFCSCGVIPLIASLLIGGVPLAPVMSFWIASPSMDPEIFMLSVATIGWKLSVWRLSATFIISMSAGFITLFAQKSGFLRGDILKQSLTYESVNNQSLIDKLGKGLKSSFSFLFFNNKRKVQLVKVQNTSKKENNSSCCNSVDTVLINKDSTCQTTETCCGSAPNISDLQQKITINNVVDETIKATYLVVKFMALAFFINALIKFYVPSDAIINLLGTNNTASVIIAALVGIPFYTSSLTALPLVSGLISLGMDEGAALAFLIAGPTTTLPAMMAVWGIVKPRVFYLYLLFSLLGAILFGIIFNLIN